MKRVLIFAALAVFLTGTADAAGPCLKYQTWLQGFTYTIGRCLDKPAPAPKAKRKHAIGELTDVSASRRVHRVWRTPKHARVLRWRYRGYARRGGRSYRSTPRVAPPQVAPIGGQYLIAFSGIGHAIDMTAAQRIASAQQRTLAVFGYDETAAAVAFLRRQPGATHSVLGFSAGAAASTLSRYMAGLDRAGVARPFGCITVGLYDLSASYRGCVNYLDHSGQHHARERNAVNLGAGVSHLDPRTGALAQVAALMAPIVNVPKMIGDAIAGLFDGLMGSRTAVYDIAGHTVYLPNGDRLEAHSGLGAAHDNPGMAHLRWRGPVPPNDYRLTMRESRFHGVRALRLNPVDQGRMHGRDGILAHTYMRRSGGQSAGCLVFRNYPAFLSAFERGAVNRIVVVARLDSGMADVAPPAHIERSVVVARTHRQRHVRYASARVRVLGAELEARYVSHRYVRRWHRMRG